MRALPRRSPLAVALALVLASGAMSQPMVQADVAGTARSVLRCSEPFGGLRSPDMSFVVATARPDTVSDRARTTFGQLAEVHRAGGATGGSLGGEDATATAVLVPWGFDDRCRPIPWTGSWRWAEVGAEGFYRGRLRAREQWIDDRPTLDVEAAVWEGFPVSPWEHPASAGRQRLSAIELFGLYDRLPTSELLASRPYGAVSDLVDWRRDAGDLAERYPARTLLASAFRVAEVARLRTSPLPYAGTYRVRVEAGGDTLASFLLRTGPVGSQPLGNDEVSAGSVPNAPAPSASFAVAAALAAAESRLSTDVDPRSPRSECSRELGLHVWSDAAANGDAARTWRAELPIRFLTACFSGAAFLGDLQAPGEDDVVAGAGAGDVRSGEIRQEADGRFTFSQPAVLASGESVLLSGERVGMETLPTPAAVPDVP